MSTKIILKKSSVASKIPTTGDLDYGELAINYQDGKLWYKDAGNNIKAFIDSANVQSAINAIVYTDSDTTVLVDSDYVRLRQDYNYNSLTSTPYIPSIDTDFVDSARVTNIINAIDFVDSADVTTIINAIDWVDSSDVAAIIAATDFLDSADAITLIDSDHIIGHLQTYVTKTGTETLTNKTLVDFDLDSTPFYGQQYGGFTVNADVGVGDSTQSTFAFFSSDSSRSAVISVGVKNQVRHGLGVYGTAASNELILGLSGTAGVFKIKNNTSTTPFNLTGGNTLLTVGNTGIITISNATEASNKTTGALIVAGGIGVSKDIRAQNIVATNNITAGTNGTGKFFGVYAGFDTDFGNKTTDSLPEGVSNFYYTTARFDSDLGASTTNDLPEGSTNKYYTKARADSDAKHAISVNDGGGDGSLAYDATTGVITYQGPSASEVRAHFSAGTGVTLSSGQISIGQPVGTGDSVEFGSVTVAGDLIVGGNYILNQQTDLRVSNALIKLADSNSTDAVDIGVVGRYSTDGGTTIRRAGFFRDATNGEWYTFNNLIQNSLDSSPAAQVIDVNDSSFELGTWNFKALRGSYLGFDSDFRVFSTNYIPYTSNFTAVTAGRYAIDTSGGSFTCTLPASPTTGDYIKLIDIGNWSTNSLIIGRNGSTIEGYADDFELDVGQNILELIYINSTWQVYSSIGQRGPQGEKGDSADVGTFATQTQSIAFAIALG